MNTQTHKTIFITGASSGIGAATAQRLAQDGAKIFLHYHTDQAGAQSVQKEIENAGGECEIFSADLQDKKQVDNLLQIFQQKGGIDIFIHNASPLAQAVEFSATTAADFTQHMSVSVTAFMQIVQAVLPMWKEKKSGVIIPVLTSYVIGTPPAKLAPYITAKYALLGLAKSLAVEFGPHHIRVNMVSPGVTDTNFTAHLPAKYKELLANQIPLRRNCTPEDVAEAIAFLCSDEAKFLTGVNLPINGGMTLL